MRLFVNYFQPSFPVVAVTAWQMLFEYARIESGQAILVRGAAGSVGACATQMAKEAGASVVTEYLYIS
jgi:NADPH:quinone reductase-like Zn-dependent oxidoreductase